MFILYVLKWVSNYKNIFKYCNFNDLITHIQNIGINQGRIYTFTLWVDNIYTPSHLIEVII